ncbi:MAG: phosphoribosylformylglycinamidine synthase subunit PurL [Sedimentisphaerales bacterium]|nr:phosphoribosylformylglycinamidine synthase subunit PurL [Sedimentisphaerales bacterium]HNY79521.1 phosphoribosylformylglycinamidine synthase subunit PurL [Sedimentisphaerales bacterium]HOC62347.1 phosphoribosylformylglycinamidine synthase subunit PurL [Sedimentisphaerales bacterium]HOH65503.1 phosphoribosylformylglycinamidine synthase subunit PurL [Sedimentisphaerales bacterium]HQA89808.1 phosphoribosylformylglycinamidine synthase subunit PurL [Sedimentisphaerales bacterium]
MKQWRFEVFNRAGFSDVHGNGVLEDIRELGITTIEAVQSAKVFLIEADFDQAFAHRLAKELLSDPVCEEYYIGRSAAPAGLARATLIEVHLKSGVTDPVAESVTAAISDMGVAGAHVRTARKYVLLGEIRPAQIETIAKRVLANDCIEDVVVGDEAEPPSPHLKPYELRITHWPIRDLDDGGLETLSKQRDLFLNLTEMKAIQAYFRRLEREPTDVELESLAQTWSEHCVHKTLRSAVEMTIDGQTKRFDNLLKETVFKATKDLDKDWCISVFADNAGVVEFDEESAVCFKVETHNHPSALDPYGGAATGIGGVIRDPMGTGMGARPIANTDIFCFGEPDKSLDQIPKGVLHPRRIMKGVVAGVRDYGNRMGIPTVNGAIYFDDRYLGNPLVYCGNIGLMDKDKAFKHPQSGNLIVVVGGRTGRDGIHGATFSSGQMTHEHETVFSHAVQIGNAITEKKMLDVLVQANEAGLYEAITDCGAGGLSSAVGEMGAELGAEVDLDTVPLKYTGLSYTEIWISEAQERMVLAVKPENREAILRIFESENVEATVIGRFTNDRKLRLRCHGQQVAELDMDFLHNGVPKYSRQAIWTTPALSEPVTADKDHYNDELLGILSSYNVASKEWVIRQYDHEVQGGSVVKPLVGVVNDGPGDAAVIQPKLTSSRGLAISCGMNPLYGDIDPYWMAMAGIDEAVRNLICVGGRFDRIALLDNFCWGNCTNPRTLGTLVRAAQACYDGAMAYGAPFISGKDSLNNEFACEDGTTICIPATLLISAMSIVDDVEKCVTMDAKKPGNLLFVVGRTSNELGGSHYYKLRSQLGANVPRLDLELAPQIARKIAQAIADGLVASCHDCSEGGLAVALAEMAFAGGLGIEADLHGLPTSKDCTRLDGQLFSESNSRYVVEVEPRHYDAFARLMLNLPFGQIGKVTAGSRLVIRSREGRNVVDAEIDILKQAWQKTLDW